MGVLLSFSSQKSTPFHHSLLLPCCQKWQKRVPIFNNCEMIDFDPHPFVIRSNPRSTKKCQKSAPVPQAGSRTPRLDGLSENYSNFLKYYSKLRLQLPQTQRKVCANSRLNLLMFWFEFAYVSKSSLYNLKIDRSL